MQIEYTDLFNENIVYVSKHAVENTITNPDNKKSFPDDNPTVFFIKKIDEYYHLLADTQVKNDKISVLHCLRIPNHFVDEIGSNEPLIILEKIAEKCGLTMQIGNNPESKFIAGESFALESSKPTEIIKIQNPENKPYITMFEIRIRNENSQSYVDIATAITIDTNKFKEIVI